MPVVAALLFEFCLRELRLRTLAGQVGRKPSVLSWLHPAERIRIQLCMATGVQVSAESATRHVRVDHAAKRLYQLRISLAGYGQPVKPGALGARRVRRTEHRAHQRVARRCRLPDHPERRTAWLHRLRRLRPRAVHR